MRHTTDQQTMSLDEPEHGTSFWDELLQRDDGEDDWDKTPCSSNFGQTPASQCVKSPKTMG